MCKLPLTCDLARSSRSSHVSRAPSNPKNNPQNSLLPRVDQCRSVFIRITVWSWMRAVTSVSLLEYHTEMRAGLVELSAIGKSNIIEFVMSVCQKAWNGSVI